MADGNANDSLKLAKREPPKVFHDLVVVEKLIELPWFFGHGFSPVVALESPSLELVPEVTHVIGTYSRILPLWIVSWWGATTLRNADSAVLVPGLFPASSGQARVCGLHPHIVGGAKRDA